MDIENSQFKCMNTFTHDNRFRTSKQPLPDQNKIFEHKNIKNAGKHKEEKNTTKPKTKPKPKPKPKPTKDIFDVNESIGNHNKIKLKKY